jgi:acetoacetyl-CoA synthetase
VTAEPDPVWVPSAQVRERARLTHFSHWLRTHRGVCPGDYRQLWQWSVEYQADFWSAIWDYFGVRAATPPRQVLDDTPMPGARWFDGATLNFVGHVLRAGSGADAAVIAVDEDGAETVLSWDELSRQAGTLAATLAGAGVGLGDRVAGYLPNCAEAVVAFLATASLGAIWAGCGQDYAPNAALERFAQLTPKVLIAADGYRFGGKAHDRRDAVAELRAGLPGLTTTIMVPRLHAGELPADVTPWDEASRGAATRGSHPVAFGHPLWILFSSGTTGKPKGILHSHGGILLEQLKVHALHNDLGPGGRLLWYTSPSWVMWNILVGALVTGASIVCYDGSPGYPHTGRLWDIVAEHQVTVFGTSPGYLGLCADAGLSPGADHDLPRLRVLGTTGSPLPARLYHWAAEHVGRDVQVAPMSGGTDVATAFAAGVPTVPVWPGEMSAAALGVALESADPQGKPLTGEVGELVVTRPMPSMPVAFWDDPDGKRYREAYFDVYPGVWRHGDWVTVTDRGSVIIHGRSDSTLNRNGVRMGSADIYACVEALPEIADSLVLGIELPDGGYWMPLFVVPGDGHVLDDALRARIASAIRATVSPRHVPDVMLSAPGIPRTQTGKKLEVPLKRIFQGAPADSVLARSAVDRPDLIDWYERLAREWAARERATGSR